MVEWGHISTILNLGKLHTLAVLLSGKEPLVPTVWEFGLDPGLVWILWKRENSLSPAGNRTPYY
jgi:hypothetical protein